MSLESQFSSTRHREADITGEGFPGGVPLPSPSSPGVPPPSRTLTWSGGDGQLQGWNQVG